MAQGKLKDRTSLEKAMTGAASMKEVLERLGLRAAGGNYKALRAAAENFGLSLPNYDPLVSLRDASSNRVPDEVVFVKNSTYTNRREIKKRLLAQGVPEECDECGNPPFWNGKPLVLQLEHDNGIWNDNRPSNLRLLCPNCHSQTETFAGKSSNPSRCAICSVSVSRRATHCTEHASRPGRGPQRTYPELAKLIEMVESTSFSSAARQLGVSDQGLRKHMIKRMDPADPIFHKKPRASRGSS